MSDKFPVVRVAIVAASIFASVTFHVAAFAATPAEAQKARHEHYEKLGDAFKAVRDGAKSDSPDWAALQKAVDTVHEASQDQIKWFPKGSGPEAGKTRSLPAVWTKPADFEAAMKMFEGRTPALVAAAKAKDKSAVDKAFKEVGGSCKNCHDNFRAPE
jgi:cytochrome c556